MLWSRRRGLAVFSEKEQEVYFDDFDEAVITELSKRFYRQYFPQIRLLQAELEEMRSFMEGLRAEDRSKAEDAVWLKKRETAVKGKWLTWLIPFSYQKQRAKLNSLIDNLFQKNAGQFQSREQVFNLFAQAALTGRILPLVRLIKKTYGPGSFKKMEQLKTEKGIVT